MGRARWMLATVAVAALIPAGCDEPAGELDPDVVHDLSRTPGDAEGSELDGLYEGQLTIESCGCPELSTLDGISLCQTASVGGLEEGDSVFAAIQVVQTDGIVLLELDGLAFTGGLREDGSFSVGALLDMTTLVTTGNVVTRVDGAFDLEDAGRQLEARVQLRLTGDAAAELEALGDRTSFDCVETFTAEARRTL